MHHDGGWDRGHHLAGRLPGQCKPDFSGFLRFLDPRLTSVPVRQSLIGAVLIFCGFNISASKIIALFVGVCFLVILYVEPSPHYKATAADQRLSNSSWWARRDWLSILTILFATGMIVAFFFIAHGQALRWYMLFLGVMSSLYSVYDICGKRAGPALGLRRRF